MSLAYVSPVMGPGALSPQHTMVTSSTELFAKSSLQILRSASLDILSQMLNPRKRLLTEDGQLRDYRGLAELAHLEATQIQRIEGNPDHMRELVKIWCRKNVTVYDLVNGLMSIGRFDVYDDGLEVLIKDCEYAQANGIQDHIGNTQNALTLRDIRALQKSEQLVTYDAMILHSESDFDQDFAFHLVERMEALGLKVFLPCRDLVVGMIEHSASEEIIDKRCDKVIAIFSKAFLESPQNRFLVNLAQYVNIQKRPLRNMLIPIILEQCELPTNIAQLSKLRYEKSKVVNFYQRFYKVFGIDNALPALLKYPDDVDLASGLSQLSTQSGLVEAVNHTPKASSLEFQSSFTNINSVATTFTEINSSVSQLNSSSSSLSAQLPSVPQGDEVDPSGSQAEVSSPRSRPRKFLTKIFGGKKAKAYEPVPE
eukprot:maker-scaffold291_size219542-snap-gene-1.25 protein:Tk04636 transcript:maker-scaffold291_size219542-snap-gene-1.25-mRNA-1 annotation:"hypothetical protein DAPPUDRAFT_305569"